MRTLLLTLSLAALSLLSSGCKSRGDDVVAMPDTMTGTSVYTQVGMHFDVKSGRYFAYSTNHLAMSRYVPPGTHMTYQGTRKDRITLTDDNGSEFIIEFEAKHSMMSMPDYMAQQFGDAPPTLPDDLTDEERKAIEDGEIVRGMSRKAMFLAVGYPPKSLNPSLQDNVLRYQLRRVPPIHREVHFGADDRIVDIIR